LADGIPAKALTAVCRQERTEAEMRSWLADREVEPEEIDRVVGFLIENLAIDDARFARAFAADKRELSGWGSERIEETLRARGIPAALAREAIAPVPDESGETESEVDRAVRVLRERSTDLSEDRGRGRALGLLARRGYSADDAYAAIRRLAREG